jgi:23S rRNA (adenine2503-C2)-methyltransferase
MDLALLEKTMVERGEPAYRVHQVWEWTARGAASYEDMTTLPKALRSTLTDAVPFSTLDVVSERESKDGTVKALFRTADGHPVEAVLMRYRDGRRSLCLSSQSGCPLTCTFCATGAMQFGRNLTASEIVDQALHFRRKEPIDHAVYMGMGEPFLNFDEVLTSARRLPDLGITPRRTTISTVGWMPGLSRFVDEVEQPIRLALSLHAAAPAKRSQLMPVNDRYPLSDVLAECRRYVELRRRKVFIEYVMLAGVNDSPADAKALAAVLEPRSFKVNLIPYNPTGLYEGSSRDTIERFKLVLDRARIPATVRLTRGRDLEAACGQLAAVGLESAQLGSVASSSGHATRRHSRRGTRNTSASRDTATRPTRSSRRASTPYGRRSRTTPTTGRRTSKGWSITRSPTWIRCSLSSEPRGSRWTTPSTNSTASAASAGPSIRRATASSSGSPRNPYTSAGSSSKA